MSDAYLGEIRLFSFPKFPVNWLPCDGRTLQVTQFQALFALLGPTYGGDGVTTFCLPDLSANVPIHFGQGAGLSARPLGSHGGVGAVTLTSIQMPAHSHLFQASQVTGSTSTPGSGAFLGAISGGDVFYVTDNSSPDAHAAVMSGQAIQNLGSGTAHNNVMPTLVANFCICVNGLFPTHQ